MNRHIHLGIESRLYSVDSREVPLYRFDVLVCGSGAAGSAAALAAAESGAEVALISKADLQETNTLYAQGGMAAVLSPDDSFASHVTDTLAVGCGLCDEEVVEAVVRGGPRAVECLMEWGARFDRDSEGELELSREGGHRQPRIVHARGDSTGREIQSAVLGAIQAHERITTFARCFVIDVLCAADGRVVGALVSRGPGDFAIFSAGEVILATGGAGQLYRETTNPAGATGDGVAIGLRAGAIARDMEFFQFHPTLLYIAGAARVLISEIVRGAGGVLRDRHGERFMPQSHPDAELAPRDVVSRAVFERMVETEDTSVYLDLSDVDGNPHTLFPSISRICHFFGIDIARDPVPVRPGAHYLIGGLQVDADGRTSVEGLFAAGECASSGMHGANRMGSNSLLESLVLGARAGQVAAASSLPRGGMRDFEVRPPLDPESVPPGMKVNIQDVTYSLKSLMWRQMGLTREARQMEDALSKIQLWTRAVRALGAPEERTWELSNLLLVAQLCAVGAQLRTESRGVHFRSDYPELDAQGPYHTRLCPVFDPARLVSLEVEHVPPPTSRASVSQFAGS